MDSILSTECHRIGRLVTSSLTTGVAVKKKRPYQDSTGCTQAYAHIMACHELGLAYLGSIFCFWQIGVLLRSQLWCRFCTFYCLCERDFFYDVYAHMLRRTWSCMTQDERRGTG